MGDEGGFLSGKWLQHLVAMLPSRVLCSVVRVPVVLLPVCCY